MEKNTEEKSMTVKDFQEVIIPAMEGVFATKKDLENFATKKDLEFWGESLRIEMKENFVTKSDFQEFRDLILASHDKILKNLDTLF